MRNRKFKGFVGILLSLTMLLGVNMISLAATFPDVKPGEWYYDTVNWVSDKGLITGYSDGRFGPNDVLQRGQFVSILHRLAGAPEQSYEAVYSDVPDGAFYSIPAIWAKNAGVVSGYADGRFGPTDEVTREQVATILCNYAKKIGADTSASGEIEEWPDGKDVSSWAAEGVRFAVGAGLIRGSGGYILPRNTATRAEIAAILQRFVEFTESAEASNISNTDSQYTIEADVKLTGTGTGYHAKIIACTESSAVSFGLQYDQWGVAPYTDKTTFLIENIDSNNAGGQSYHRTGYAYRDKTYHLMLTVQNDGRCDVYVNGACVGTVTNPQLANQKIYLRVEGSGRKNNDSVHAEFTNIKLKGSGVYNPSKVWGTHNFNTNAGIHNVDSFRSDQSIVIDGKVVGLSPDQDWDNAYGIVSDIIQFVE